MSSAELIALFVSEIWPSRFVVADEEEFCILLVDGWVSWTSVDQCILNVKIKSEPHFEIIHLFKGEELLYPFSLPRINSLDPLFIVPPPPMTGQHFVSLFGLSKQILYK